VGTRLGAPDKTSRDGRGGSPGCSLAPAVRRARGQHAKLESRPRRGSMFSTFYVDISGGGGRTCGRLRRGALHTSMLKVSALTQHPETRLASVDSPMAPEGATMPAPVHLPSRGPCARVAGAGGVRRLRDETSRRHAVPSFTPAHPCRPSPSPSPARALAEPINTSFTG
jgi:hypothetical protein